MVSTTYTVQFIRNGEADEAIINRVIALKQVAWPYSDESQIIWLRNNLSSEDIHVILKQGEKDVAYLNLCEVYGEINGIHTKIRGVGNVCAVIKGMGYGSNLFVELNDYLKRNNEIGMLFCHARVDHFYAKCGWTLMDRRVFDIHGITPDVHIFSFNMPVQIFSFKYNDRLF